MADEPLSEREIRNMKQITETQATGSLQAQLRAVIGSWPPTPEQIEKNKAEKAELDFVAMKNRIIGRERRLEHLKERARRKLRGEFDDE
jgi:hypothetical protein